MLKVEILSETHDTCGEADDVSETVEYVTSELKKKINEWLEKNRSMVEVVDVKTACSLVSWIRSHGFTMTATILYKI